MKIGILMTGHTGEPLRTRRGDLDTLFAEMLDGHGFTFEAYDVEGMALPTAPSDADGWIITGSKHGAYEDHAFIPPLEAFIRACHAGNVPLVGICFGHQIVAQALGGRVEKADVGWSVGRTRYEVGGSALMLNAWHQDQVTALPECATVLGRGDLCPNAVVAYGDRILTVQPHPEFDAEVIGIFAETRRGTGTLPNDRVDAATAALPLPTDNARMADAIARFLKTREIHV